MRTLNTQEVAQVSGGKTSVVVDVNVPNKTVFVNVVVGTKVTTLIKIEWGKWFGGGNQASAT